MVSVGIGGLAILVAAIVAAMVWVSDRRRFPWIFAAMAALMAVQWALAASGLLRQWQRMPPIIAPLVLIALVLAAVLAFSGIGEAMVRKLSIGVLIGFQVFRLPLELLMHRAATHGIMPMQMSYSGYNLDILSGITALPVAWVAAGGNFGRVIAFVWNLAGTVLLAVIVVIALISSPPVAAFGAQNLNTWVADTPYIWLPGVLVPCALLGHLLVWRRWSATRQRGVS